MTRSSAATSPESSPPSSPNSASRSRLPPLSRMFPSRVRYTHVDELPSRQNSLQAHSPIPDVYSPFSGPRRHFMELDVEERQREHAEPYHDHEQHGIPDDASTPEGKPWPKVLNVLIPPAAGSSSLPTPIAIAQASPPPPGPAPALHLGDIITETDDAHPVDEHDGALKLELIRTLGKGAFSSVWLARDVSDRVGTLEIVRKSSLKRSMSKSSRKGGLRKRRSMKKKIEGAVPKVRLDGSDELEDGARVGSVEGLSALYKDAEDRPGRSEECSGLDNARRDGRVVALKMTDRSLCERDDRTRVSFVREVEVLKVCYVNATRVLALITCRDQHISHPSIVSYIHAFNTPSYHVLVLEHISGGELFDLVSTPEQHARIDEPLLRRIFGELCRAVSWMHAVGLVHRDIKLESTSNSRIRPLTCTDIICCRHPSHALRVHRLRIASAPY